MVQKRKSVRLFVMFLMAVAVLPLFAQTPVSTLPYFCGFEDAQENANWTLNRRGGLGANIPLPTNWTIGTGAKHSGYRGLYVYNTNPDAAEYNGSSEVLTVADREFSLPIGTYDLALDWRCLGDSVSDAIYVYWVPASTNITGRSISTLPTGVTPLTFNGKNFLSGTASWKQAMTTVNVNTNQNYKLVIVWRNNATNTYNPGGCVDNVQLQVQESSTDCWHTATNIRWTQGQTSDVLSWTGRAGASYDIFYWLEGAVTVDSVMNVTSRNTNFSYTFPHGLLNSGIYGFAVRTNCGDMQSIQKELLNVKSLGDFSMIAEACPEVNLMASLEIDGEKYMTPSCDETGQFRVKPTTVAGGGSIAGYRVDNLGFDQCPFPFDLDSLPAQFRNAITTITRDDYWDTQLINLPFAVCFYDGTYRQALVGANGIVTFDPSIAPNSTCAWSLTGQPDIPSTSFIYKNCIMGVYQDYYPVPGSGGKQQIWYGVLGEWPCRKMVVCFNEVPMFANHSTINSSMIVMYEGTNVIDVYVKKRDLSPSGWNDNRGIIGIINADGTDGVAAPGRNTSDGQANGRAWSANYEAWRFTPYSTPVFVLKWYKGAFATPAAVDAYIAAHPNEHIELAVADSLNVNKADSIDAVTVRLQYSQCNGDFIDIVDYARIMWPQTDTIRNVVRACQGRTYSDNYINRADSTGIYNIIIPNHMGCDSIWYELDLTMLDKDTIYTDTVLCAGQMLDYGGIRVSKPGTYPVSFQYSDCDCDSVTEFITLKTLENLNVQLQNDVEQVCGDDVSFSLGYSVIAGRAEKFDLVYDQKARAAGFVDLMDQEVKDAAEIEIPIQKGGQTEYKKPGTYSAKLTFFDRSECTNQEFDIQFDVLFPSSVIYQRWDDVLSIYGFDFNGGYRFNGFQWMKDGQYLEGETKSYYYAASKLNLSSEYQVLLTDENGNQILTCPFVPEPSDVPVGVAPSTIRVGEQTRITVPEDAKMVIYSTSGNQMRSEQLSAGSTMIDVPSVAGMYIIRVEMTEGARSFRITVTE